MVLKSKGLGSQCYHPPRSSFPKTEIATIIPHEEIKSRVKGKGVFDSC